MRKSKPRRNSIFGKKQSLAGTVTGFKTRRKSSIGNIKRKKSFGVGNIKRKSSFGKVTPFRRKSSFGNTIDLPNLYGSCTFNFLGDNLNLKNQRDIKAVYDITEKLGTGTFGTVKLGVHKITGQKRAIKNIYKTKTSKRQEERLETEMNMLQNLSHPNILPMIEYFETSSRVYIVTDVYEGGELFTEIIARGEFTDYDASVVISQLLSCIAYLLKKNIVHRDLKPENILLEKSKKLESIKIIDFGHAIKYDPCKDDRLKRTVGTPFYMAPEILYGDYGEKVDVWSVGVISYILLCGRLPFGGEDKDEVYKSIERGKFAMDFSPWAKVSDAAKDFVKTILILEESERPGPTQLLKHPFISDKENNNKNAHNPIKSKNSLNTLKSKGLKVLDKTKRKRTMKKAQAKVIKNLKAFRAKQRLAKVVHSFVVTQCLPKEEKERLADIFRDWDQDNDGLLSKHEFTEAIKKHAPKVAKMLSVDDLFSVIDIDGSGFIEYQEFLLMATDETLINRDNLLAVFEFLDKDGSGFLEVDELSAALVKFDEADSVVEDMISEADTDGDGKISKEEFLALLQH